MRSPKTIFILLGLVVVASLVWYTQSNRFYIPSGETVLFDDASEEEITIATTTTINSRPETIQKQIMTATREIFITNGIKHSIPLNEILSGGPGKDGIPSIDEPLFISAQDDSFLNETDPGVGLVVKGESRFYPYRILVWHEIVNDTIQGEPVLITYCPLCATGIVFDRRVRGVTMEFGVSGRLWQSNLLMYDRAKDTKDESLWSQVLGEAVLGVSTGEKLSVLPSDIIRWSDWKKLYPETKVLSANTGASRDYSKDPYGDYYSSESVSFGATFSDTRLHPKAIVYGIEIGGLYKAYSDEALKTTIEDVFAGKKIVITRTSSGVTRFKADGETLSSISGFWFSWLAVHPETELFK